MKTLLEVLLILSAAAATASAQSMSLSMNTHAFGRGYEVSILHLLFLHLDSVACVCFVALITYLFDPFALNSP